MNFNTDEHTAKRETFFFLDCAAYWVVESCTSYPFTKVFHGLSHECQYCNVIQFSSQRSCDASKNFLYEQVVA